jgi:hypothetical protein
VFTAPVLHDSYDLKSTLESNTLSIGVSVNSSNLVLYRFLQVIISLLHLRGRGNSTLWGWIAHSLAVPSLILIVDAVC